MMTFPGRIFSPVMTLSLFCIPMHVPARSSPFTSPRRDAVSPPTMSMFACRAPSFNPMPICAIFATDSRSVAM